MNPYIQYMYSYPHKTAYRPLEGIYLKDYAQLLSGGGHGMYFHVPFCQSKCGYCNLFSVAGQGQEDIDRYLDAVERQSSQYQEVFQAYGTEFSELAVGGGTPLYLTERQLERVFAMAGRYFQFDKNRKIIVETAPNQTNRKKLEILRQAGVARISMGVQSFCDQELKALGRHHSAKSAQEALELIKSFEFPCVNVDFIYGIPGQTVESLLDSLKKALYFDPEEIFLYPLYIKHGVSLEQSGMVPDAEAARQQYRAAGCFLKNHGYRQDSMRRFVRGEGEREFCECGFGTSIALGCGGRSYLGSLHFCSPYAVKQEACLARLAEFENTKDHTKITYGILLSKEELKRRYVIRHLLIRPGLNLERYDELFGSMALEDFPILEEWMESGYIKRVCMDAENEIHSRIQEAVHTRLADCALAEKHMDVSSRIDLQVGDSGYLDSHLDAECRAEKVGWLALTESGMELSDDLGPQLISPQIRRAMMDWEDVH